MQNFTIQYWYDSESNQYIAEIPELNISDYWNTIDEASKNLQKWLTLYFEETSYTPKNINNKQEIYA